ncbi:hypothetical protein [Ravibacter arvi]
MKGAGDPSTAVGMTHRLERLQTCCCQWYNLGGSLETGRDVENCAE